jgi:hypothetical protein
MNFEFHKKNRNKNLVGQETPTSYLHPIVNFGLKNSNKNTLKVVWLLVTSRAIYYNLSNIDFLCSKSSPQILNICYNFFFKKNLNYINKYKSLLMSKPVLSNNITSSNNYSNPKPISFFKKNKKLYDTKMVNLIRIYIKVNTFSFSKIIKIHPGWSSFFFKNSSYSVSVVNISKFYNIIKRCYYLIFNLFYYSIAVLSFGNIFFSKEVNSINWNYIKPIRGIWRYVNPFLSLKPSKIFNYGRFIFEKIKVNNINTALVLDYFYHRKTFFYLNRCSFYTIALVPTNCSPSVASYSIPSYSDGIFSQLFFIRFIIFIRKESDSYRFQNIKNSWNSLLNSI